MPDPYFSISAGVNLLNGEWGIQTVNHLEKAARVATEGAAAGGAAAGMGTALSLVGVGGVGGFAFGRATSQQDVQLAKEQENKALERADKIKADFDRGYEQVTAVADKGERAQRRAKLDIRDEDRNFVVVGLVSSGKTSFINSCRGLNHRDGISRQIPVNEFGLGEVGNRRVTKAKSRYRPLDDAPIAFWDLPGMGGCSNGEKSMNYYQEFELHLYDCIILAYSNNFSQFEAMIVKQYLESTNEMNEPPKLFVVQTKSDSNLESIQRDSPLDGEELVAKLKEYNLTDIRDHLTQEQLNQVHYGYHVSTDALWEAVTGSPHGLRVNGKRAKQIDEIALLKALKIPHKGFRDDA